MELHFNSNPPGAEVYAESAPEELLGVTPFTLKRDQSLAMARFILRKDGYADASEELSLAAGGSLKIVLGLAPPSEPEKPEKPENPEKRRRKRKNPGESPAPGDSAQP